MLIRVHEGPKILDMNLKVKPMCMSVLFQGYRMKLKNHKYHRQLNGEYIEGLKTRKNEQ